VAHVWSVQLDGALLLGTVSHQVGLDCGRFLLSEQATLSVYWSKELFVSGNSWRRLPSSLPHCRVLASSHIQLSHLVRSLADASVRRRAVGDIFVKSQL
jgi:hypothetical protein